MRISDTQFSQMMLQSLQINNAGLGQVMQQMSTGERLTKLSDDPMASVQLLNLEREGSAITQYKTNISNVKTALSNQEVQLDSVNESLKKMNELVLWGANGTLTDSDRTGIISELESLRSSVVSSFNAQDEEGRYLFDCLSVCVNDKKSPEEREFWGWWLELEQEGQTFAARYRTGLYDVKGDWVDEKLPKKAIEEVNRTQEAFHQKLVETLQTQFDMTLDLHKESVEFV